PSATRPPESPRVKDNPATRADGTAGSKRVSPTKPVPRPASHATPAAPATASPAPTAPPTAASGTLPCSTSLGMATRDCAFAVTRQGNGTATLLISKPDGGTREFRFEQGNPVAQNGLGSELRGTLQVITLGDERYEIPRSVIYGS
ncbi:MAG: hypothetical protein Q4G26_00700, partial [Paracoccus sp. (in: a-proteobacteria)]|nr:hypothetical protein [Paracoccus sp. (in: a-proteobacteria)]